MFTLLQTPLRFIDRKLDRLGMYRVVTLALVTLVGVSFLAAVSNLLPYTALELGVSLAVVVGSAMSVNWLLAKLWKIHTNHESALITALIMFFLIIPAEQSDLKNSFIIALAVSAAMASKYLLVWRKQHLLNPVATGVVAVAILYALFPLPPGYFETAWWIGQPILFLPLVLVGAAVVRKVRKETLVLTFLTIGFMFFLYEEWQFTGVPLAGWERFWLSGPSVFLACFMLTEPFTMPPTTRMQSWYGAVVGFLSQTTLFLPAVKMTPELALIIGNIAVYPWRLRRKLILKLKERREIADSIYEFVFEKPKELHFEAGQYLEWMSPHESSDSRGIRRYFTIASAPTESDIRLALKVVENGSSYKRNLMELDQGETIIASQLAGDFLLPKKPGQKLGFIAGGIGVTPFRSHIQHMADTGVTHDVVLFYCVNRVNEIAYQAEFAVAAEKFALEVIPTVASEDVLPPLEHGYVTKDIIERRAADYLERTWYLSGPPPMVHACAKLLQELGVPRGQIVKDFFPGLA